MGMIRNIIRHKLALIGLIILIPMFLSALLAPIISPHNPVEPDMKQILSPPSIAHPFGTDTLGRDVFSRVMYGSRISLLVGFVSIGIAVMIGIVIGAISGYYGGMIDEVFMRFVDLMMCFPTFFLILAVIALLEPSIWNIMIVIGLTNWMGIARLVRAEILSIKNKEFVLAAKAQGFTEKRIIFNHVLPNSLTPVYVVATLGIGGAILTESALSFLGIGVQPPTPSWGNILTQAKDNIEVAWWLSLYPGLAIFLTVMGYNLLGEGLRDIFDPRRRYSGL
ncbi:MAG TPA: ABC transporter permease [Syntrophorhabdaceae bacterium]|nr:ABC transporter permease [Syntrophorhabdaceae bacterium]HON85727.1 ABC transporter permease [Syntrophorhabdaceae bacterium]HOT42099.1 ABC transporter permease [Syntrophorhabdaceae bacterium]HQH43551.1 ABC transporter permease [Syntrophorhabdaceae bacterium]HQK46666.1 ABC transporter permease [Syntrophorhabdaceae bacterium]